MPVWWLSFRQRSARNEDEIVRIVAVAREANPPSRFVGPRTKIAVDTLDRDVDRLEPVSGARGSRIQVVNELGW